MYKVIAYYTKGTPYESEVEPFIANLKEHGFEPHVQAYPAFGSWTRNTALKAIFISSMLEKEDCDLLYLDIDARIRRKPVFFDNFQGDIGCHFRRGFELLAGTIYLRNNEKVRAMVRDWCVYLDRHRDENDQQALRKVIVKHSLKITDLPASYTQIFDKMAHNGPPVIEHMQASRKYREVVRVVQPDKIPASYKGVRIRRGGQGCYFLTRPNKAVEAFLDQHLRPVGNLKWYPKSHSPGELKGLKSHFEGKICNIVGKGPSLDLLQASDLVDGPTIGINEATHTVAGLGVTPLFGLQQDARLKGTCQPEGVPLFVSIKAASFYHDNVYIFDAREYDLSLNTLSVMIAIQIAKSLGASGFRLLCFDACVNQKTEYAQAIPYSSWRGGPPTRFLSHRSRIESLCQPEWVIPEGPASASSDTPQP